MPGGGGGGHVVQIPPAFRTRANRGGGVPYGFLCKRKQIYETVLIRDLWGVIKKGNKNSSETYFNPISHSQG
jgi:hypothetical protein